MAKPKTYFIQTFGCQMNLRDSETMAGLLEGMGYTRAERMEDADIVLFNTCAVRANPENRLYGNIGEFKRLKEKNPNLILGVAGCMVQQKSQAVRLEEDYPQVDLVFGTHNIHQLPDLIRRIEQDHQRVFEVWDEEGGIVEGLPVRRESGYKAWVTIMYGCNNFCTYCIVPYTRGRERSRRPEDIIAEVEELGRDGYKEVTLLGQNVNSYGKDLKIGFDFADLLARLDEVPGIVRIRYTTSHPKDFSQKLIDTIAASKKVADHFHLPLQAGSDRILRAMRRVYTYDKYLDLVNRIRKAVPTAAITTDLIVGFPGETEEDFQKTLDAVEEVRFDGAFTFIYSPREGTKAAEMPDQVPEEVKKERIYRLIEVQNRVSLEINQALMGKVVEVMVDGPSEKDSEIWEGRTTTNKLVLFKPAGKLEPGALVDVRITDPRTWTLGGELVQA